jgi:chromosome segregation ATPase
MDQIHQELVTGIKNGEGSKHNDTAMRQNLAEKTAALELAGKRIKELDCEKRDADAKALFYETQCEAAVKRAKAAADRIVELEDTIREHEKDLAVIEELQDEQTKLVALLMRRAEGKPVTVTRGGITFVPNPRIPAGWVVAVGQ